jgi:Na+-transporting methylmalonyl-CoA/oxaloacetate decarboxylase gamma subunit
MSYEGEREKKSLGCMTATMRYFLILANFLFVVCSIIGIVATGLLISGRGDSLSSLCLPCRQFNIYAMIVFCALFVFSLVGFFALWKRNGCLLMIYGFFMVIFFLMALCITVVVFMIDAGNFDKDLESSWKQEVEKKPADVCQWMKDYSCSGWDHICPEDRGNMTADLAATCPDCAILKPQLAKDIYALDGTCHDHLKEKMEKYYWILLGVGFGLMVLSLISICVSCKVRVQYDEYSDLEERF